jgi:hypothetical protein
LSNALFRHTPQQSEWADSSAGEVSALPNEVKLGFPLRLFKLDFGVGGKPARLTDLEVRMA